MPDNTSASTSSSLNFELFEECFIIRPSNPWKEVDTARKKLQLIGQDQAKQEQPAQEQSRQEQPKPEPPRPEQLYRIEDMEEDRDKIVGYASLWQRSGRTIGLAICLAAHLRRFSTSKKIADVLATLSTGLDLQSLDETSKLNELERCCRDLNLPTDTLPALDIPANGDATTWRTALEQWLAAVNNIHLPDVKDVRRDAWAAWESRLRTLAQRRAEEPADINYLRSRAEGSAPGTILPARLSKVALPLMTDALTIALTVNKDESKDCPPTFSLSLLEALGFDLVNELGNPQDSAVQSFLQSRSLPTSSSPRSRGVLIVRTPASRTGQWGINPTIPTLATTVENYGSLFNGKVELGRYLAPRLIGVLFEVDRTENVQTAVRRYQAELKKLLEQLMNYPSIRGGLLLGRPVADINSLPAELRAVAVAPADVADAVRQAFQSQT